MKTFTAVMILNTIKWSVRKWKKASVSQRTHCCCFENQHKELMIDFGGSSAMLVTKSALSGFKLYAQKQTINISSTFIVSWRWLLKSLRYLPLYLYSAFTACTCWNIPANSIKSKLLNSMLTTEDLKPKSFTRGQKNCICFACDKNKGTFEKVISDLE